MDYTTIDEARQAYSNSGLLDMDHVDRHFDTDGFVEFLYRDASNTTVNESFCSYMAIRNGCDEATIRCEYALY